MVKYFEIPGEFSETGNPIVRRAISPAVWNSAKLSHAVLLAVVQMVGVPAFNGRKMQKSSDATNEYLKWQNRLNVARVDHLTKTERNALYRARGFRDGAARKAEVMANGTEKAKRILKNAEKYIEDGFASHGRRIQAAIKAYRDKHGKDSVIVEVEARIRLGYGSGLTKSYESRARVIVKDDPHHNSPWTRLPVSQISAFPRLL
jgi:hypothetical protein